MENLATAYLFVIGACFGSFASVVIYRIQHKKAGIFGGRSECTHPKCQRVLSAKELVPILSWVFQRGKCSGCGSGISPLYPVLEIVTGILFAASGRYLCDLPAVLGGDFGEIGRLAFFLSVAFVTVVYAFYDLLTKEIPDTVLVPATVATGLLVAFLPRGNDLFRHFEPITYGGNMLWEGTNAFLGALAIYAFFYLQFLIPAGPYLLRNRRYADAWEALYSFFLLPFAVTKDVFFRIAGLPLPYTEEEAKKEEERWSDVPTWIGLGDLRIGVFMGFVGGLKISLLGLFLAYVVGSVYGIYVIGARTVRKLRTKTESEPEPGKSAEAETETEAKKIPVHEQENVVPFGPFLAIGLYLALFFYEPVMKLVLNVGHP